MLLIVDLEYYHDQSGLETTSLNNPNTPDLNIIKSTNTVKIRFQVESATNLLPLINSKMEPGSKMISLKIYYPAELCEGCAYNRPDQRSHMDPPYGCLCSGAESLWDA